MPFRSRAVRSLVELHEREMRSFLQVWSRFAASDLPMPEAHGDESYENRERLAGHVLMAARGYLIRIGEWVGRPVSDVDGSQDPREIVSRASEFADDVLSAYRRHLAARQSARSPRRTSRRLGVPSGRHGPSPKTPGSRIRRLGPGVTKRRSRASVDPSTAAIWRA